jgi:hypothetical protein
MSLCELKHTYPVDLDFVVGVMMVKSLSKMLTRSLGRSFGVLEAIESKAHLSTTSA